MDDGPRTDDLLREQVAYYRARAPIYDDWWERRGSYALDERWSAAWDAERQAFEDSVSRWLDEEQPKSVLEIAGGTGNLTRLIAPHVDTMTVLDSSPEVLDINRTKVGAFGDRIDYRLVDIFDWAPDQRYDAVAMGFWMSHVPDDRWAAFWATVRMALRPDGSVWLGDNATPDLAWKAGLAERPPDPYRLTRDGTLDLRSGTHERSLPDGSTYLIVKRAYTPDELVGALAAVGLDATAETTEWAFITAVAHVGTTSNAGPQS